MEIIKIQGIPAIVYGEPSEKLFLFIHGKNGYKEEAEPFATIACRKGYQVLSFDLPEHGERKNETGTFNPWHAVSDFKCILSNSRDRWDHISVRANSIGAYFSMLSFARELIDRYPDNLTQKKTVDAFVDQFGCKLTIMDGGEHWFHTPEQLEVLEQWTKDSIPD